MSAYEKVLNALEHGEVRAAVKDAQGNWEAVREVKEMILESFRQGANRDYDGIYKGFVDKNTLYPQEFSVERKVRMVPGGSSVRRGAYVAAGVIIMPPSYINIGAYVDEGTMVDSHVLVGSCAQVGKRVHLSAGVQIGGVLEPVGMRPVVIEDDCFIGANTVIVEGIVIRTRAVLAPGVILSRGVQVYDCVNQKILERGADIPAGAVVVPGSRPVSSEWGKAQGLSVYSPMIVKYRDEKSETSLVLEEALR